MEDSDTIKFQLFANGANLGILCTLESPDILEVRESEETLRHSPLVVSEPTVTDYIGDVMCRVAGEYCPDVRVYVVRNPTFNAGMAPNGMMIVNTGLLVRVTSSDQLASVIGHELAHYTLAHSLHRLRTAKKRMTAGALISMGLAAGGVSAFGLPDLLAMASVMGFTRAQESDADLLGLYFMEQSGYDPHASSRVWQYLEEEEAHASIKGAKRSWFLNSHPAPKVRTRRLSEAANEIVQPTEFAATSVVDPLTLMIQTYYETLMDDQVKQGDFGRLMTLLDRHAVMGIRSEDVAFYRGEAWRVRQGAGDHEHAIKEYRAATTAASAIKPRAFRELGYLLYKHGQTDEAVAAFGQYLVLRPTASDREMVEFYMEGGWQ